MIKKTSLLCGVGLFLILFLGFSFWLNLPSKELAGFIQRKINAVLPPALQVEIDNVNTIFYGAEAFQITLQKDAEQVAFFEKLTLHIFSFKFFLGRLIAEIDVYNGSIDLEYGIFSDEISISFNEIHFNRNRLTRETEIFQGFPIASGEGTFSIDQETAALNFILLDIRLNEKNKIPGISTFLLPKNLFFTSIEGKITVQKKIAVINVLTKGNFSAEISGMVTLGDTPQHNLLDLVVQGTLEENFAKDLQGLDSILVNLINPYIKGNRVNLSIKGSVKNPVINNIDS